MLILKLLTTYFVIRLEYVYDIIPRRLDAKVGLIQLKLNSWWEIGNCIFKKVNFKLTREFSVSSSSSSSLPSSTSSVTSALASAINSLIGLFEVTVTNGCL